MEKRITISRLSEYYLQSTLFFIYTFLSCFFLLQCLAKDTITEDSLLNDGETLVSVGERFELGFFSCTENSVDINRYVGIWYHNSNPRIFVWVANRDNPIPDSSEHAVLAIYNGNLRLTGKTGPTPYFHTEVESSPSTHRIAKLMDSGNLVLRDNQSDTSLWESFKHPTDTFLVGMKMDENLSLTSWNSQDDPRSGNFTFKIDQGVNQFQIQKSFLRYWRSAAYDAENDEVLNPDELMPNQIVSLLSNFSRIVKPTKKYIHSTKNSVPTLNMSTLDYASTRLIMNVNGEIQFWREDKVESWSLIWSAPPDRCSLFHHCGNFGICNSNDEPECKCLPGFVPKSPENWNFREFSGGCIRKSTSCSGNYEFSRLRVTRARNTDSHVLVTNETECSEECLNSFLCKAYSYDAQSTIGSNSSSPGKCWIWTEDLYDLEEDFANGNRDVYVRVVASDIESTKRICTCGVKPIPYPLSTNRDCGDHNYFSFLCNTSTGHISFKSPSGTYPVLTIISNLDIGLFTVQVKDASANYTRDTTIGTFQLNKPFYVINAFFDEFTIGWDAPQEPVCSSPSDCEDWPDSTCNSTENVEGRCLCKEPFRWAGRASNCTQESGKNMTAGGGNNKQWRDEALNGSKKEWALIIGATTACVFILSCTIIYFYIQRKKATNQDRTVLRPDMAFRFCDNERHVKDMVNPGQFKEEDKEGMDLPFFDFESILAATDNFSEANKLGKGGFGPVYKGKFSRGQEMAVKRLSSVSGQGLEEFKNEVVLIARLQHRNLVRLLGYCIERSEKILLYEYMTNKSLDFFLFDRTLNVLLDWEIRFNIILGIARGLLYLHQDSRLRIIHRDLKTSNILLDQEMNPKISDFGLARILEAKQTVGTTNRVVGTYGYMSPEYAFDGFFSVKSDVFSFGVVVLEIISGKKNTGFYNSEEVLSLLGYAWRLWQNNRAYDIMDEKVRESSKTNEILKCINVGLLCVQEDPNDRPTMANIVIMLGSEAAALPVPKQPAFVIRRGSSSMATSSSSSKPETNTKLTITLEAR